MKWCHAQFTLLLMVAQKAVNGAPALLIFPTRLPNNPRPLYLSRFLVCDCQLRWVAEWIERYNLQVTSRERNPQFCGHPTHLKDMSFYQLGPEGESELMEGARGVMTKLNYISTSS